MSAGKVLVVEDEIEVVDLLREALESAGFECIPAGTVAEAQRVLDAGDVDAVTLDLGLPGRSGLDWLGDIAGTRPDVLRKVIVVTGTTIDDATRERLDAHGTPLLEKPFSVKQLVHAVRDRIAS